MPLILVRGRASGRELGAWEADAQELLMRFLHERGIPIASSCDGEGVCRRCTVNGELLSCQTTVGAFMRLHPDGVVVVDYL